MIFYVVAQPVSGQSVGIRRVGGFRRCFQVRVPITDVVAFGLQALNVSENDKNFLIKANTSSIVSICIALIIFIYKI